MVAVAALPPAIAGAADPNLLPAEQAFQFGARPLDAKTVEARFTIADGYYLYRDKLRFTATPALGLVPPVLPGGQIKQDEFFGRVETYRGEVRVRLTIPAGAPGSTVAIEAESQGCADIGVCYPPTRQRVALALPANDAPPGEFVPATPPRKSWFGK